VFTLLQEQPEFYLLTRVNNERERARHTLTEPADTVKTRSVYKLGNVFIGLSKSAAGFRTFL
jgi:hypothetical protein